MKKIHIIPSIFLIILGSLSLFFTSKANASFTYSHGTNTVTVTYASADDFSSCPGATYWSINIGYNDIHTQIQSSPSLITDSTSLSSSFDVPNGTPIQLVEVWTGDSLDNAAAGQCTVELGYKLSGLFNWGTTGSSTDTTPTPTPVTVTVTSTVIKIVTPTPTPTPVPDTTKPTVSLTTNLSKPFAVSPQILGTASDNKGVSKIEYSLNGGQNYLPVDNVSNLGKTSVSFSVTPQALDDGNYNLKVRATDSSGNIGFSKTFTLVIDRLPPQVSGVLFSLGPQVVDPGEDGSILAVQGQSFKITLSDVGGATSIDIFADPSGMGKASSGSGSKKFSLKKNPDNGLWSGNIILDKEGEYRLGFSAVDGAGNKTDRDLNKVRVVRNGNINAPNAKITVYFFNTNTNEWNIWDGSSYGQNNPLKADSSGNYSLFLPAGKYYLRVEASGFQALNSKFFTLNMSQPINADFTLKPLKLIFSLGFIKLYWPDFSSLTGNFKNNLPQVSSGSNILIGKQLPFFSLTDGFKSDSLTGKLSILTFLNTWSPTSAEQISILNNFFKNKNFNSVTLIEGEKSSKVYVFQKRGGYNLPMYTDPDATLVPTYNLSVLPTSYFIDRKGIIRDVVVGVLSQDEIESKLLEISN